MNFLGKKERALKLIIIVVIMVLASVSTVQAVSQPTEKVPNESSHPQISEKTEFSITGAKANLVDGNKRFVEGKGIYTSKVTKEKRTQLAEKVQRPFAAVVCCSDSRVPPEIVFDQALGDLYVIRTAGNVIDVMGQGSLDIAVKQLKVPLIVILGHQGCGAVKATVEGGEAKGSIEQIISFIEPSFRKVKNSLKPKVDSTEDAESEKAAETPKEVLYTKCEDENIKTMMKKAEDDNLIKSAITSGALKIEGAKYTQETGVVTFVQ